MSVTSLIHPTAVIEGDVELAEDVVVGPHSFISGPVTIGAGTRLLGQVWIQGRTVLGQNNVLYPGTRMGGPPQDLGFDHEQSEPGIQVGNDNIFREGFTGHRGKSDTPTCIGDHNYFMTNSHVGHDSQVGNHVVIATGAVLGGHVQVDDRVTIGGNTAIHQMVHLGYGSFLTGGYATSQNVPPWFMLTATNTCGSLNLIGMRRSGMSRDDIRIRKRVYQVLYRQNRTLSGALNQLRSEPAHPIIDEYLTFIERSERAICHGQTRPNRGGVG